MSLDKNQRIVLITGANRGIGREMARQLAERGFFVVVAARDEDKGRRTCEEIQAAGGKADFLLLDVSSSESVRDAAQRFSAVADRLDVLINNVLDHSM